MANAASMRLRWQGRSKLSKMLTVGLVAISASLLPSVGSFVPQASGVFGDVAQAGCKWELKNPSRPWWGFAQVSTNWCYNEFNGKITYRKSSTSQSTTLQGKLAGFQSMPYSPTVEASYCYSNYAACVTRFQFTWWSRVFGIERICIQTRIYANGGHHRSTWDPAYRSCKTG